MLKFIQITDRKTYSQINQIIKTKNKMATNQKTKKSIHKMTKEELIKELNSQKKKKNNTMTSLLLASQEKFFEKKMNEMLSSSNIKANALREDYILAFKHSREMEKIREIQKIKKQEQETAVLTLVTEVASKLLNQYVQELAPVDPKTSPNCGEPRKGH